MQFTQFLQPSNQLTGKIFHIASFTPKMKRLQRNNTLLGKKVTIEPKHEHI